MDLRSLYHSLRLLAPLLAPSDKSNLDTAVPNFFSVVHIIRAAHENTVASEPASTVF